MAITSFVGRPTAVFKNVIKFAGAAALDGRTVVDTYSDIAGEKYKELFTFNINNENIISYYQGMTVVTKDTGKLYVLVGEEFKEITPDILGSVSKDTYADAVAMAGSTNIGQIIYVKNKSFYDADGDGEGAAIEYDAGPYIVVGVKSLQKLAASTASGDIASDLAALSGIVTKLDEYVKEEDGKLDNRIKAISEQIGDTDKGLIADINKLNSKFDDYDTALEADGKYAPKGEFEDVKEAVEDIPDVYLSIATATSTYETIENANFIRGNVSTHAQLISDLTTNLNTVSGSVYTLSNNVYTKEQSASAFKLSWDSGKFNDETGIKSYTFTQGSETFTIDIPADLVVKKGEVVNLNANEAGDNTPAGTYIKLILNATDAAPIFINAANLIDEYTAKENGYIDITNREISIKYSDLKDAIISDTATTYVKVADLEGIENGLKTDIATAYTNAIATAQEAAIQGAVNIANAYTASAVESLEESIDGAITTASAAHTALYTLGGTVQGHTGEITSINSNIATLSVRVETLETTVGDVNNGLVKLVNKNAKDINSINEAIKGSIKTIIVGTQNLTADDNGSITISTANSLDAEDTAAVVTLGAVKNTINAKANVVIRLQDSDIETLKSENVYFVGSPETGYINKVVGSDGKLHIAGDKYFVRTTDLVTDSKNGIMRAEDYNHLYSFIAITDSELQGIFNPEENQEQEQ